MQRKLIAISALAALLAPSAFAADMPLKAPPPAVTPAPLWTGWYIGANIGGSFGTATQTASFPPTIPPTSPFGSTSSALDGAIGGAQIGYNWQISNWVLGLEADIQAANEHASTTQNGTATLLAFGAPFTFTGALGVSEKLNWLDTVRGRLGVTVGPNWLLYATGGVAYGGLDANTVLTASLGPASLTAVSNVRTTRAGWTAGAGIEGWLGHNWTAKFEYLYVDLGSVTNTMFNNTFTVFSPVVLTTHVTDNIVRVGLNYHFN